MPGSIRSRLLLASLLILPAFLGITGYVLDKAFNNYQSESQQRTMQLQQLLLAGAADWKNGQWRVDDLEEPRLSLPASDLYAFIVTSGGKIGWQSPSAESFMQVHGADLKQFLEHSAWEGKLLGSNTFSDCVKGQPHFCYGQLVAWGSRGPMALFLIVEGQSQVLQARSAYRRQIFILSIAATGLLLLAQALVFYWSLSPLRRTAAAIGQLERGEVDTLTDEYPAELRPLTDNLKLLLDSERNRRQRVRNTMDRLAHVLKSPLMLIRNSPDQGRDYRQLVDEQVERMLGIVEGELARARLDGRQAHIMVRPVAVKPVIERIASAYARLPRAAGGAPLEIATDGVSAGARFRGEERDLQDLFGTLLENAMKYARSRIEVSASNQALGGEDCLVLQLADDGEGIPAGLEHKILERGARADTVNLGHGLGLSIVIEIISAYGGSLVADRSELGGALFTVTLPQSSRLS